MNRKRFEAAFKAYNMIVPAALYECDKDLTNFIFSCWVNETRNFDFPTILGSGSRNITMKIINGTGDLSQIIKLKVQKLRQPFL